MGISIPGSGNQRHSGFCRLWVLARVLGLIKVPIGEESLSVQGIYLPAAARTLGGAAEWILAFSSIATGFLVGDPDPALSKKDLYKDITAVHYL